MTHSYEYPRFTKIADEVVRNYDGYIKSIELDEFTDRYGKDEQYIVITFRNGAKEARNATMDSLAVMIEEMAKMLNGGKYDEVEQYEKLKRK